MKHILITISLFFSLVASSQVIVPYRVSSITAMKAYAGAATKMTVDATGEEFILCASCAANESSVFAGAGGKVWKRINNGLPANVSIFGSLLRKLEFGSDSMRTLGMYGNSIFNRIYQSEMSAITTPAYAPPYMYRQNIAKYLLDSLQVAGSDLKYWPSYDKTGFVTQGSGTPSTSAFVTLSGTWTDFVNNDYEYYKQTTVTGSTITYTVGSGWKFADLILQKESIGATSVDITVSVNGGAFQSISAAGLTGVDNLSTVKPNVLYEQDELRQYHVAIRGLSTGNTYSFKLTNSGTGTLKVWGVETWSRASLRVLVMGQGGSTESVMLSRVNNYLNGNNGVRLDGLITEYTMLNDSYNGGVAPTQAQRTATINNLDTLNSFLKSLQIPVIGVIPHPSFPEPSWYIDYISFPRLSVKKYGIETLDMYDKWKMNNYSVDGYGDGGTHLSTAGSWYYAKPLISIIRNGRYVDSVPSVGIQYFNNINYAKFNGNSLGVGTSLGLNDNFSLNIIQNATARMTFGTSGTIGLGTGSPANSARSVNLVSQLGYGMLISNTATSSGTYVGLYSESSGAKTIGTNIGIYALASGATTVNGVNIAVAGNAGSPIVGTKNYWLNSLGALAQNRLDGPLVVNSGLSSSTFTSTLVPSAGLQVDGINVGFLPPRMTAVQAAAIPSPAEGLMVYVTDTSVTFTAKGWWGYDGAAWQKLNN